MAERVTIEPVAPAELDACLALRRRVFVDEQGVDPEIEFDGLDAVSLHFEARLGGLVVGTARLRAWGGCAKAERVAVAAEARRDGVGRALMLALEETARGLGHLAMILNAQQAAVPFYLGLGYEVCGKPFEEAGIPHLPMRKHLSRIAS